ncbi:MAG TPA: tRNA uridine-5-carboxymethylaminomethyl(34) synthesis GTPase MnmE [Dongiaceae bacterium]|jgi:tRNA modification GTPase|nr:tRNA uridine-5-carboxymethylaminomethyl(34) synthesis GTPase MnmE [Dongiaceae bacterium]
MTIYALASGQGRAAIAVIRLSGPATTPTIRAMIGDQPLPAPRQAALRTLYDQQGGVLDRSLVLLFPGPASYSGEDMAELHIHGGPAVQAALLRALGEYPGLRPAEPGEFSRRAFANGKMDLSEIEGLADLMAAETEAQRRQSLDQASGKFRRWADEMGARLLAVQALSEALIEFPDEDLPSDVRAEIDRRLDDALAAFDHVLVDERRGEIVRDGYRIVLLGAPNAGKSTLLNALARRDVAIVSHEPGTTRDVLEVVLDLDGMRVILADTAGLRTSDSAVEQEGMRRALKLGQEAELRLILAESLSALSTDLLAALATGPGAILLTKRDLHPGPAPENWRGHTVLALSAQSGEGMSDLVTYLACQAASAMQGEAPLITRARHRTILASARTAIAAARTAHLPELQAEELRRALHALGRITGRYDVEQMLDILFREFCIGK